MTEKIVMCACNTTPIRFFNKPGFQHEITTPNDTLLLFNGWGSILGVGAAKIFSFRLYSQYGCIIISQSEDSVFIQPIWEYNCSKFIQPNWVYIMDKWNHHIGCITCRMGWHVDKNCKENIQNYGSLCAFLNRSYDCMYDRPVIKNELVELVAKSAVFKTRQFWGVFQSSVFTKANLQTSRKPSYPPPPSYQRQYSLYVVMVNAGILAENTPPDRQWLA